MGIIRRFVPRPLWDPAFAALRCCRRLAWLGRSRYCPVCRSHVRRFIPHGIDDRPDAKCPVCGAVERLRLLWLFLDKYPEIFAAGGKMLHFAPEPDVERRFRSIKGLAYTSADLDPARAMVAVDIADIPYPDDTFDCICCVHVLEHVPDDQKAMRQLCRVLRKGGSAIIQVPITAPRTFEDPSVTDPAERQRLFGLHDHLRRYGPDVEERLRNAGFDVKPYRGADLTDARGIKTMALNEEPLFFCKKPAD